MTAGVVQPWFVDVLLSVLALDDGQRPVEGAAGVLPWFIVACGLAFAGLAVGVGLHTARRARAQEELDRIFTLSSDLITVADFDGRFLRVNPAVEQVLGYTPVEFLDRRYMDFVHPDDRERAAAEAAAIAGGKRTLTFANRYVAKDGSIRVLEWTSTPVVADRLIYGVARDVTARYRAEADLRLVADEQAALRRVATLVATGSGREAVFRAVAEEVGTLLGCDTAAVVRFEPDGTVTMLGGHRARRKTGERFTPDPDYVLEAVRRTGRPARFDTDDATAAGMPEAVRAEGLHCGLASPILVGGELWGTMTVGSLHGAFPAGTEDRLTGFTELLATAVSNAEAREELSRLADEQAALRRVATLVAAEAPQAEIFRAIAEEIMRLLETKALRMWRYEGDAHAVVVAGSGALAAFRVGDRFELGGENVPSLVLRTGRPARIDDFGSASGAIATVARSVNFRQAVGTPIVVEGRLWGAMVTATYDDDPLPPETYERLGPFTELMATAIANAEARAEVERLAGLQAALRHVATLVAEESPPAELFAKVAEVASVLGSRIDSAILRYEADDTATVMAVFGVQPPAGIRVGARMPVDGSGITARVYREKRPVRVDAYATAEGAIADHARQHGIRSAVGCPILVRGRLWGAMVVAHYEDEPFRPDTEQRVSEFTDLVATAIANAEARAEVRRLADEQAALRRVATLVAEGAAPTRVFDAVTTEVAELLAATQVALVRFESQDEISILAQRGCDPAVVRAGMRVPLDGDSVTARVWRTGRSARLEVGEFGAGTIAEIAQRVDVNVTVGAPIVVEGALWGAMAASWTGRGFPPPDAEERQAEFAQLLGTAIANAESRDQLTASRARVLTAGDEARRRVVRDLHDGAQQRLVHTIVMLKLARRALDEEPEQAASLLAEALDVAEQGNAELRELAHGILPAVLTRGGLRAGVDSLVSRLDLPVDVDVTAARLPPEIQASAYFIVAEALTNVIKHAQAERAQVTAAVGNGTLRVQVRDDGIGGADPDGGGLVGLNDRVAALGGRLRIDSPHGGGTVLSAELPLAG